MPIRTYDDESSYYPSAKVRLILRFDELARRVFNTPNTPIPKPTAFLAGVKDKRAPLTVRQDPEAPPGVRRFVLDAGPNRSFLFSGLPPARQVSGGTATGGTVVGNSDTKKLEHLVVAKSQDGLTHVLAGIVPKETNWAQNGIRTADTCSITLRYIDCPIDPRVIRSCAVEFFLGTVTPTEHRAGLAGQTREVNLYKGSSFAEPMNLVPDTWTDLHGNVRTNRRFIGWVDKWAMDWTSDGEPLLRLDCRDNTQLLIDQEAPAKLIISGSRGGKAMPIDEAIVTYLSHFPQFAGLTVEYRPIGEQVPDLTIALAKTAFRPNLGPPPSLAAGANSGLSVWDYLTDVCGALGLIIRVEDTTVVIQRGRSIYSDDSKPVKRYDDPFVPRKNVAGCEGQQYRRFLFGENLVDMKMDRSFVRNAPTNVVVRCYDPKTKRNLVAGFPTRVVGNGIQTSLPGDGGAEEKWLNQVVSGIADEKTLRVIAQTIYEMRGRSELTVRVKTRNLASLGGGNSDPDLLDLRAGDSFELLVRRPGDKALNDEEKSTLSRMDASLVAIESGAKFMKSLGFDDEFALAYAKVYADLGLQSVFRCRTVGINWNIDDGVTIEVEGINYIEVRADPIQAGILSKDERQK